MAESKAVAMAILGIILIMVVVGLVLFFRGATGNVSYSYDKPSTLIQQPAQRLCENMACNSGHGAVVIGEETHADGGYWVCGCPKNFQDLRIADWSNQYKGDAAYNGNQYNDYSSVWLVRKIREY